jgi:predicted signal transduction protein with EAL and GGDEF domain
MAEPGKNYRKKQAFLCILVFICLGLAFWSGSATVAVGMVMLASVICFWAATMEPAKAPDEHHHH